MKNYLPYDQAVAVGNTMLAKARIQFPDHEVELELVASSEKDGDDYKFMPKIIIMPRPTE